MTAFLSYQLAIFAGSLDGDRPEIASAITALMAGHNELGVGVVIGSYFKLAALLALTAVLAGVTRTRREGIDGGVAILVTLTGAAVMIGVIAPWMSALLLGLHLFRCYPASDVT